jgi:hypothetical protein
MMQSKAQTKNQSTDRFMKLAKPMPAESGSVKDVPFGSPCCLSFPHLTKRKTYDRSFSIRLPERGIREDGEKPSRTRRCNRGQRRMKATVLKREGAIKLVDPEARRPA